MDWVALVIGLGGLFLGAFTSYLSYKQLKDERKSKYREVLYSRQVNVCCEIAQSVTEYLQLVREIMDTESHDRALSDKINRAFEVYEQLRREYSQHVVFVTDRMHTAFNDFIRLTRDALQRVQSDIEREDHADTTRVLQNYASEIRMSYYELIESMREMIGTNPLSREVLEIVGKSASP